MSILADLTVDLAAPAKDRWSFTDQHRHAAANLLSVYNDDLDVDEETIAYIASLAPTILPQAILEELTAVASALGTTFPQVVLANLHYDLLKVVLGCTAFAVDTPDGPIHGRNLDWWTAARALNDGTVVTHFVNGPHGDFLAIGWPGFLGAFSGVARGRFSVTLNAVLSDEPGQVALPIVFLLREVLEEAATFDEAVSLLSTTTIATDCLLLVAGTSEGQMVVIERTPTRFAHREAASGEPLCVTNNYQLIDAYSGKITSELLSTSCGRYARIAELLIADSPSSLPECIDYLGDSQVMMEITVQQMAFRPRTGEHLLRIP
ncbi:MAG: C45 family peptidase [Planctomycetota bacterium]